jgi:predicted RNA-binding protein with PIN domain
MHIVIDGYNLIRQSAELRRFERIGLEAGRKQLIVRLQEFRKARGHSITVVFDGSGPLGEERLREGAVTVVYSRRGEKADDVIKRMAAQGGKALMIVTSDRDLAYMSERFGATVIPSRRFEQSMDEADQGRFQIDNPPDNDDERRGVSGTKKKGPSRKMPKNKRVLLNRMKKL